MSALAEIQVKDVLGSQTFFDLYSTEESFKFVEHFETFHLK